MGKLGFRGRPASPEEQAKIFDALFFEGARPIPYLQQYFVPMLLSAAIRIQVPDKDADIDPVPTGAGGATSQPELDRLSITLMTFNDLFGNIAWTDDDRVQRLITEEIPARVAADHAQLSRSCGSRSQGVSSGVTRAGLPTSNGR
jgi:hypothetical protein